MQEYETYDGLELAAMVKRKEVSPTELLDAAVARCEAVNPSINAVIDRFEDEARKQIANGLPAGPFVGVPFLTKDLVTPVAGRRSTGGSRLLAGAPASAYDGEIVRRYRRAGLVLFGTTNTPEFGLNASTESALFGPARNPWDLSRTTGGSSGGSAAAVASAIVPMAHGTDGGGSLRIPASCCGVFALKPTRGRTPLGPDLAEGPAGTLHVHAITRSVRDSAALLDATAGPDIGDPYAAPPRLRPYLDEVGVPPRQLRIALQLQAPNGASVHPECVKAAEDAAALCEQLGHIVEIASPTYNVSDFDAAFQDVMTADMAAMLQHFGVLLGRPVVADDVEPITFMLAHYGGTITGAGYASALQTIRQVGRQIGGWFENFDLLLTPTLAQPPLEIGELSTLTEDWMAYGAAIFAFAPFTSLFNATGQPSMSVPLSIGDSGLPIGVQFAARFGDEATLFRLAGQLETACPWSINRPHIDWS